MHRQTEKMLEYGNANLFILGKGVDGWMDGWNCDMMGDGLLRLF